MYQALPILCGTYSGTQTDPGPALWSTFPGDRLPSVISHLAQGTMPVKRGGPVTSWQKDISAVGWT